MSDAQYQQALVLLGQGRHDEAGRLLGQASAAGHVPAMSLLGAQLLTGRGAAPEPVAGIRLIMAAAERGGGYACAMAASLLASGLKGKAEWPRALDLLQRGAEAGFPSAQDQLRLLAGRGGEDWAALRRAVDLKAWRRPPARKVLRDDPRLWIFERFVSPQVCDWIIARARDRLAPAKVFDQVTGGPAINDDRINSAAEIGLTDVDLVLLAVRERIAAAAGQPMLHLEGPQVLHYHVGERFILHHDYLDPARPGYAIDIASRGQRLATCLVYLNDDLEGGETEFPELGIRHRGAPGDALMFFNVDASGLPDPRTMHAGLSPTSGEKWVLSQWIRDRVPPGVGDPRYVAALEGR